MDYSLLFAYTYHITYARLNQVYAVAILLSLTCIYEYNCMTAIFIYNNFLRLFQIHVSFHQVLKHIYPPVLLFMLRSVFVPIAVFLFRSLPAMLYRFSIPYFPSSSFFLTTKRPVTRQACLIAFHFLYIFTLT